MFRTDMHQDEAGTAAIKAVELDTVLGGRAVQHRETQGHESDKFLSYFRPCIVPLEGGFASGFKKPEDEKFETRLYICKGKRVVRMKQVPFARSSLNHDDVFILDTETKIYQFNGANSNIQERAKALEVVQHLKDQYHGGKCDVAIIEDGKLVAESDSGEFWVAFGGFAPIGKKAISEDDVVLERTPAKIYSINDGQLKLEDGLPSKALLENNKCFILDCGAEVFVWVGRVTQVDDRKAASKAAEEFVVREKRPKSTRITQVIQGYETHEFKSNFESWPVGTTTSTSGNEEGRGKVAALLKQQGVDVNKGAAKATTPVNEEVPPLLESNGKLEVWCVNSNAKTPLAKEDIGKFYCGDCYIVLYTYHSGEKKEEFYLTTWIGKESVQVNFNLLHNSYTIHKHLHFSEGLGGRIYQGKEPPQFISLFQPMVLLKGGISTGYKKLIADSNMTDETYTSDGIALVQVSGTSAHNNKSIQVEAVASSLSSSECFVLQSGNALFTWHGNASSFEQQQWAAKVAEFLKPGAAIKHTKEGTESSAFWFALGGKQSYSSKAATQEVVVRDPHLYTFSLKNGKLEVSEVFNFCQDDLLTEDILILDTHAEVFVWIGQSVDPKEKQKAFDVGQKYIEHAVSLEGLSLEVPLYKVSEGYEPCFFKVFFSWDNSKSVVRHNMLALHFTIFTKYSNDRSRSSTNGGPTQRASALAALTSAFNSSSGKPSNNERSKSLGDGGPTQRASAMAALTSAFNSTSKPKGTASQPVRGGQGSQRAAAVAALSSVLTAEQIQAGQTEASICTIRSSGSLESLSSDTLKAENTGSEAGDVTPPPEESTEKDATEGDRLSISTETADVADFTEVSQEQTAEVNGGETTFSYDRLKSKSTNPVRGIDYKRRETYLSDEEFKTVFGLTKEMFYQQPKWKQDMQKRKLDLF
ncbi:villin-3-like protein [Carex littledalei]|uniref:Villin-3-like protein n=1 Tax=Carex littledalei TaxID=544730 RepID=A0A833QIP9_9POAL|nr:villin-3-like protein [Carex littledalei]